LQRSTNEGRCSVEVDRQKARARCKSQDETQANLRGGWRETLKVVNSFALLESSSHDASLVLLVHSIGKLELQHPLACDGLDAGRKSRDLDDSPAAHLLDCIRLKIQRSFPQNSIRSDEGVLILERLSVSSRGLCWIVRELLVGNHLDQSVADRHNVCVFLISSPALGQQLDNFGKGQPFFMIVTRVEETIRIRVGIIRADLGDEVAKSGEEVLELATDKKQLVDSKQMGGDSRARRR
jgi:hypothetical protein